MSEQFKTSGLSVIIWSVMVADILVIQVGREIGGKNS